MALLIEGNDLDTVIHLVTAIVGFTLFILSFRSYQKIKRQRFQFICAAFFLFALKEVLVVLDVLFFQNPFLIAISHFLNLIILLLFFMGVIS